MSNLSILDRNILLGLEEESQDFYLKLRDKFGPLRAEQMTWEWEKVRNILDVALPIAVEMHGTTDAVKDDLLKFIKTRHINRFT